MKSKYVLYAVGIVLVIGVIAYWDYLRNLAILFWVLNRGGIR